MDLSVETKSYSRDDISWLGSRHGTDAQRSVTLDHTAFDGAVPSGTPLAAGTGGKMAPYTGADGQTLAGFLAGPVDATRADQTAAMLVHGQIIVDKLPVDFTPPATATNFYFA